MCPACATVVLTIAGVSYAVNKLRKQNNSTDDKELGALRANSEQAPH